MNKKNVDLIFKIAGCLFLLIGAYFFCKGKAQAENYHIDNQRLIKRLRDFRNVPDQVKKADWLMEYEMHKVNGLRTYLEARNKCWCIPNLDDREMAKYCFLTALGLIPGGKPCTRLVTSILALCSKYGVDAMDDWQYVQNKLNWSKYHYEMCDFYFDLLKKA